MLRASETLLVIAEAGVNHNGSLKIAHEMIDAAHQSNADVVKFQLFESAKLATDKALQARYQIRNTGMAEGQRSMLKSLELDRHAHKELAHHAAEVGLEFLSTPFDPDSLDFLVNEIGVRRIKLSSADLTNVLMVSRAALSELPVILSTGMASLSEVGDAVDLFAYVATNGNIPKLRSHYTGFADDATEFGDWRARLTILQCTSEYPTPPGRENIFAMVTMGEKWRVPVGYSDHTLGSTAAVCAVALGACVLEKHFSVDKTMPGPDQAASLSSKELTSYVKTVRHARSALGSGEKVPTPVEQETALRVRKVLVAARDISEGEPFSLTNVSLKRANGGFPSAVLWELLGRPAKKSYESDDVITDEIHER